MQAKCTLLIAALALICAASAGAFTGNVDTDPVFAGPGVQVFPDVVADPASGLAGCDDGPLSANAFQAPQPTEAQAPPSGFNIERVVALFDCLNDDLFVGLDTCDPKIIF